MIGSFYALFSSGWNFLAASGRHPERWCPSAENPRKCKISQKIGIFDRFLPFLGFFGAFLTIFCTFSWFSG